MTSADTSDSPMFGACADVSVNIGGVSDLHNFFVMHTLSYPVILGQPWIHKVRLQTQVLRNGKHWARLSAGDNEVQFRTVPRDHPRHRTSLLDSDKPDPSSDF